MIQMYFYETWKSFKQVMRGLFDIKFVWWKTALHLQLSLIFSILDLKLDCAIRLKCCTFRLTKEFRHLNLSLCELCANFGFEDEIE